MGETTAKSLALFRIKTPMPAMSWKDMAGVTGLEPATSGVTGQRSNQLSYTPAVGVALV